MKMIIMMLCALLTALVSNAAQWTDPETGIVWSYIIYDGKTASVGGGGVSNPAVPTSTAGAIEIPSTLGGKPVTGISGWAFYMCYSLTSVTIPPSVTTIGERSFAFGGLTNVTMSSGLTRIGNQAFYACGGLRSASIPEGVTSIGDDAFSECSELTNVTIPSSVKSIGNSVFYNCTGLQSVTIPEGVVSIGNSAFHGCSGITSITMPNGMVSIGSSSFYDCVGLTSLTIPDGVTSIGDRAFYRCTGLTDVSMPECLTNIGASAFYKCGGLTNIVFAGNAPTAGSCAFYNVANGCAAVVSGDTTGWDDDGDGKWEGLTLVWTSLPRGGPHKDTVDGIEWTVMVDADLNASVGSGTYGGERAVPQSTKGDVVIPSMIGGRAVTGVGDYAFWGRNGLTSVMIPPCVTSIGDWAFYAISGLTNVTVSSGVTRIGESAFSYCSELTSMIIPESVVSIADWAFYKCSGLTNFVFGGDAPSVGVSVFNSVASGCTATVYKGTDGWDDDGDGKWQGLTLVWRTTPQPAGGPYQETVDGIKWTFKVDSNLNASVGSGAFYSGLAVPYNTIGAVAIPSTLGGRSVTSVGREAFYNCHGLTSMTIPLSVTSIGGEAFRGCNGLTNAMIAASVTSIGDTAFCGCSGLTGVTIPSSVTNIGWGAFSECSGMTSVTIPSSVTSIGDFAFNYCRGLMSMEIPLSVTSISQGMFYGCRGLTSVKIPPSVMSIGDEAFRGCSGLTSVTIPSSVTNIGMYAFSGCGVTNVTIPPSVTRIGEGTFEGCSGLASVTIPSSVTSIGYSAFYNCSGLTRVTIPEGVVSIGGDAFKLCSGLTSVEFPSSITSIGRWAFDDCSSLTSVTIPPNVTNIGYMAFSECDALTAVDFEGAPPSGVGDASIKQDAAIRYNIKYAAEWLPVVETCGWTNAKPYDPLAPKVSNVMVQQRYPWNGKVDISYTVANAGTDTRELSVWAVDHMTGITNVAKEVSGDTKYTNGRHHVVWDMTADGMTLVSTNVVFTVAYRNQYEGLYFVIDISGGSSATSYPITCLDDVPTGGWSDEYKTSKIVLRRIDPGTCVVTVDKPYYVGVFEVTQKQYELVTGETPSQFSGDVKRPVEYVSYDMIRGSNKGAQYPDSTDVDANSFMGKLRSRTGLHVDLPTEAQWEYAGRAGATTRFFYGESVNGDYMWYSGNSGSCPHEVGTRKPNGWGLYDVHGNVFEKCLEWYSTGRRVLRGGGWFDGDGGCSFYYRAGFDPSDPNDNIGFRLVSTVPETADETIDSSDPIRINLTEGTRSAAASETITYSTAWVDSAGALATAVVSVNGQVVSEVSGSGTVEWTPEFGGTYQLTHQVMENGEPVGEALHATYWVDLPLPEGGPYHETVDDIEWTFMIDSELKASTGQAEYGRAVPQITAGGIEIPSELGGRTVESIGDCSFYYCSNLTDVSIPSAVTNIGDVAFAGCVGIGNVILPDSLVSIGGEAFANSGLTKVTIPSGIKVFGQGSFYYCEKLASVTISDGVPYIGNSAFHYCTVLSDVAIPSSVTTIGISAFSHCEGLTNVTMAAGVSSIQSSAFDGCANLIDVGLPSTLTQIGATAFYGCSKLAHITIPASVQNIGMGAFASCTELFSIDFQGLPPNGVGNANIKQNASIRYNALYAAEWQPVITSCGWTNAKPYTPGKPELSESEIQDWVVSDLGTRFAKPGESPEQYQARFEAKFGKSYTAAFDMETGKVGPDKNPLSVWHDYVAGTDPLDLSSQFKASVTIVDGKPVVSYTPELNEAETARRIYVTYGKENLQDTKWFVVPKDQEYNYNFFKVTVEMIRK